MAKKPLRPCGHPGCQELTQDGWCEAHRPKRPGRARGPESEKWHKLYAKKIWTNCLRPSQLLREPFCRECAKHGIRTPATEVDHVVPHQGDIALFEDPQNLQSLCHRCHSAKTMRELRQNQKKRKR